MFGFLDWLFFSKIYDEEMKDDDDWRITAFEGDEYGIYPFEYDTEEEYRNAVLDAQIADLSKPAKTPPKKDHNWRLTCEIDYESDVMPYDYETEEEYLKALEEWREDWRERVDEESFDLLDPYRYGTEEEYKNDLDKIRYGWREEILLELARRGYPEIYLNPYEYETLDEYLDELEEVIDDLVQQTEEEERACSEGD